MIDYDKLKNWRSPPVRHSYTARDVMLYALGVGMGQDLLDRDELRFVYERDLRVLPSMAAVLASPGFWVRDTIFQPYSVMRPSSRTLPRSKGVRTSYWKPWPVVVPLSGQTPEISLI